MRADCLERAKERRRLIATIEKEAANDEKQATAADAALAAARAAVDDPTKPVEPMLTHKEAMRIMRETGVTKQQLYRARKRAALSEEEFEARLARRFSKRAQT